MSGIYNDFACVFLTRDNSIFSDYISNIHQKLLAYPIVVNDRYTALSGIFKCDTASGKITILDISSLNLSEFIIICN